MLRINSAAGFSIAGGKPYTRVPCGGLGKPYMQGLRVAPDNTGEN